jgi:ATP-dependent RNA/DNA helicase IGHMBP2
MDYFKNLQKLLKIEREADKLQYTLITEKSSPVQRRESGLTWYPIAIRGQEVGHADYLTVEVERTTHHDIQHQFRFGMPAVLFSNHDAEHDRLEGTITNVNQNRLKITLKVDELPDWSRDGKLGIDMLFDDKSYEEMADALKVAENIRENGKNNEAQQRLIRTLTGQRGATFHDKGFDIVNPKLNDSQNEAVNKILAANELAIIHGPPGTGKTTTIVQAIKASVKHYGKQILVVAPSNTAVDLLTEKLADEGLEVLRVGNPNKVSEAMMGMTLDHKIQNHDMMKNAKKLKKQAAEYKSMAHKYKRSFGRAEREQRKALFDEAHRIMKEVDNTTDYITDDLFKKAQIITATLVGANNYTVRKFNYHTIVIDEAGQALEPACWIPILKAQKVIMAGDHCQLPPTIKSNEASRLGLSSTLLEKCIELHPDTVTLLDTQYRMHEAIMAYSSKVFYGNILKADTAIKNQLICDSDIPVIFIDTAGCSFDEVMEGTSATNPEEAQLLIKYLGNYLNNNIIENTNSIAIISPYKKQIELLNENVVQMLDYEKYKRNLSVNTIDSFQGQERDIVCISLVRSNSKNEIGFLTDVRRMNVAMTRPRKKLIIIGDSATLSTNDFYRDFIDYCEVNNFYFSAYQFIS